MTERSSHPLLALTDSMATRGADAILLVGRVLLAVLFLMTVWSGGPSADYLKSLGYFAPAAMSVFAHVVEWVIVVSLLLGVGTRYGALLAIVFVVIAFGTAALVSEPERNPSRLAGPVILGLGLAVVWVVGMSTGQPAWANWLNFAFALAFLTVAVAAAVQPSMVHVTR